MLRVLRGVGAEVTETIEERFARLAPAVHAEVAVAQAAVGARSLEQIDTADVDPCPGCGVPVRRFSTIHTGPWWCRVCIQARCGRPAPALELSSL